MIWAALLLGMVLGIAFDRTFEWILITPLASLEKLNGENADLKKQVATLQAQLEAVEAASWHLDKRDVRR